MGDGAEAGVILRERRERLRGIAVTRARYGESEEGVWSDSLVLTLKRRKFV